MHRALDSVEVARLCACWAEACLGARLATEAVEDTDKKSALSTRSLQQILASRGGSSPVVWLSVFHHTPKRKPPVMRRECARGDQGDDDPDFDEQLFEAEQFGLRLSWIPGAAKAV